MRDSISDTERKHVRDAASAAEAIMPGWKGLVSSDGRNWKLTRGTWDIIVLKGGTWCCHNGDILGTGTTPQKAVSEAVDTLSARYAANIEALTGKRL